MAAISRQYRVTCPTPATEAARNRLQECSDNAGLHFSTSPATKDRYLPSIDTIPEYIPLGLPPIVYTALFHSFSTGNHALLDRSTTEAKWNSQGCKGRDKRIRRILRKIVNHHNSTGSPLRNPSASRCGEVKTSTVLRALNGSGSWTGRR